MENMMNKNFQKKKTIFVYRSAITGRFVSSAYAARYPQNSVRERVKVTYWVRWNPQPRVRS